jgi:hypothetical protein
MIAARIGGVTRILGKSQGYLGLPVRDEELTDTGPCMTTAWIPTPDELARINAGANIHVKILGRSHPPILVEVGEAP